MPVISMFFGIYIRMFYDDHNPPHFHAKYNEFEAVFDFDGNILKGDFPVKQQKLVVAWIVLHEKELKDNWNRAKNEKDLLKIDPLK